MANTRFYFDERKAKSNKPCVLKIAIAHKGSTALISLSVRILPSQWDKTNQQIINHPDQKLLNAFVTGIKQKVDTNILYLENDGKLGSMTTTEWKYFILEKLDPEKSKAREENKRKAKLFSTRYLAFAESKKPSTKGVYMQTYRRMEAFAGNQLRSLTFEDITKEWLAKFETFLAQTAPSKNARNIHFRNIRAVFNEAIDDEITTFYPFRRFKIRPVATRKRNLKIDDLNTLFTYPCEEYQVKYVEMFKLMFMLIGINAIDLYNLKKIEDGRINYYRAKTNKLYSIKLEPEALEIINKYRGKKWLLDIHDRYKSHHDYLKKMNNALKNIGPMKRVGRGGKKVIESLFPDISSYWARHSWATIAASLDIPRDTIAHALGHGNNTVTDIYIDFDQSKVDEANRQVIDWVFYGKKPGEKQKGRKSKKKAK